MLKRSLEQSRMESQPNSKRAQLCGPDDRSEHHRDERVTSSPPASRDSPKMSRHQPCTPEELLARAERVRSEMAFISQQVAHRRAEAAELGTLQRVVESVPGETMLGQLPLKGLLMQCLTAQQQRLDEKTDLVLRGILDDTLQTLQKTLHASQDSSRCGASDFSPQQQQIEIDNWRECSGHAANTAAATDQQPPHGGAINNDVMQDARSQEGPSPPLPIPPGGCEGSPPGRDASCMHEPHPSASAAPHIATKAASEGSTVIEDSKMHDAHALADISSGLRSPAPTAVVPEQTEKNPAFHDRDGESDDVTNECTRTNSLRREKNARLLAAVRTRPAIQEKFPEEKIPKHVSPRHDNLSPPSAELKTRASCTPSFTPCHDNILWEVMPISTEDTPTHSMHEPSYQPGTPPAMHDRHASLPPDPSSAVENSARTELQHSHACVTTGTGSAAHASAACITTGATCINHGNDGSSADSKGMHLLHACVHEEAAAANAWLVKHLKTAPARVKRRVLEALRACHEGEAMHVVAAHLPKEWNKDVAHGVLVMIERTTLGTARRQQPSSTVPLTQ